VRAQLFVQFEAPAGGMAVWTHFDPKLDLEKLSQKALQNDLYFNDGGIYHPSTPSHNATRLGFASSTPAELERCVEIMARVIKQSYQG